MRLTLTIAALLALCPATAAPPEELFFGLTGLRQRIRLTEPLTTASGDLRLELVEVDRLAGESGAEVRLILRCRGRQPAEAGLVVLGDVYAVDEAGRELAWRSARSVRAGDEDWLALTFADSGGTRLSALSAAIGPRPEEIRTVERLDLARFGEPTRLPVGVAARLAVVRRETTPLPIALLPPPLYRGIDSTQNRSDETAASAGRPYLTLRLFTLARLEGAGEWRLANLSLPADGGAVEDWRYRRLLWRPDWGGWLGVRGEDWEPEPGAPAAPGRGVKVTGLVAGGPADRAGLQEGDLLAAVGGLAVDDAFTLGERVRMGRPGGELRCEVWRGGRRLTVTVTLGEKPLWPEVDEVEFREAWEALKPLADDDAVLSLWDWQTRAPLPAAATVDSLDLDFRRQAPSRGTTILFRQVPLVP